MGVQTYTLIDQQVLTGSTASVTFSNIPQTYEDLVLEIVPAVSGNTTVGLRYNGDSTSGLYSNTGMYGDGSTAASWRLSSQNEIRISYAATFKTTNTGTVNVNILSYSNGSVYKTLLSGSGTADGGRDALVGLWRNTAAVTSIVVIPISAVNFVSGSTFRLYGLVA